MDFFNYYLSGFKKKYACWPNVGAEPEKRVPPGLKGLYLSPCRSPRGVPVILS